jgi:hypothetical protein
MKHLFCLLASLFIYNISNAQTDTTNWIYELDNHLNAKHYFPNPILKVINNDRVDVNYFLGSTLRKEIKTERLRIYQDENCNQSHSSKDIDGLLNEVITDTIIVFDAETFAEEMKIVSSDRPKIPSENTCYKLTQSWQIDKKTKKITAKVINYDIIQITENDTTRLFSIKNPTSKTSNAKDIIWMKNMTCQNQFNDSTLVKYLLSEAYLSQQKLMHRKRYGEIIDMDYEELEKLYGVKTDSLMEVDPKTFKTKFIPRTYSVLDNVKDFRVVQDFSFNAKTNSIESKILAIGVVIPSDIGYSLHSQYLYYNSPAFWIVYDDDFLKTLD